MGNKYSVAPQIVGVVEGLVPTGSRVCDLFSGTGVVSAQLAREFEVLSVDIQAYSRVLVAAQTSGGRADFTALQDLLDRENAPDARIHDGHAGLLDIEDRALQNAASGNVTALAEILEMGSPDVASAEDRCKSPLQRDVLEAANQSFEDVPLSRAYGGLYFSYRQTLEMDEIAGRAWTLTGVDRDVALAALLSTASELVSTIGGHFAQPLSPRDKLGREKVPQLVRAARQRMKSPSRSFAKWLDRYLALPSVDNKVDARTEDYRSALSTLESDTALVYADPPYTRDHYSRFYHVLETIALGDKPSLTPKLGGAGGIVKGAYRLGRHQSPFSINSQVHAAFRELFAHSQRIGAALVTSYSPSTVSTTARKRPRLMEVGEVTAMAEEYYQSVSVIPVQDRAHSKFNARRLNGPVDPNAEVLIVASDPRPRESPIHARRLSAND